MIFIHGMDSQSWKSKGGRLCPFDNVQPWLNDGYCCNRGWCLHNHVLYLSFLVKTNVRSGCPASLRRVWTLGTWRIWSTPSYRPCLDSRKRRLWSYTSLCYTHLVPHIMPRFTQQWRQFRCHSCSVWVRLECVVYGPYPNVWLGLHKGGVF